LPVISAYAKVCVMERNTFALVQSFEEVWKTLTRGGMVVLIGTERPELSVSGRKLPRAVQQGLESGKPIDQLKHRGALWWVRASSEEWPVQVRLIAWAKEEHRWSPLLQAWTDSIAYALAEQSVAEELTGALVSAWDRLTFLYELTQIAGQLTELPVMLGSIVELLAQVVTVDEVFLVTKGDLVWESVTTSGRELSQPETFVDLVRGSGRPMGLDELLPALARAQSPLANAGDLLVAPLHGEDEPLGVIGFADSRDAHFDANDVQLLASVAEQVSALIEAAHARAAREERQRMEHELAIAANIQASLLPVDLPQIPGLELAAYLRPAQQIGGDFYDVASSLSGHPMLLIADVAGKGPPAAILTAVLHATFRGAAAHQDDPANLLNVMGRLLYSDLEKSSTFVTATIVRLGVDPLNFKYASAGHADALIWRNDKQCVEFLPATGLPLGIEPSTEYFNHAITFQSGDVLLLYSDGITEAVDPDGKVLGLQGLSDIIYATHPAKAEKQIETLIDGLDVHRRGLPLEDDVALILIREVLGVDDTSVVVPFVIPAEVSAVSGFVKLMRDLEPNFRLEPRNGRELADNFALALTEIVTNQIQHAYPSSGGRIQGSVTIEENRIIANLYDYGVQFRQPPETGMALDIENPPNRGYGLKLVRGLVDECVYSRIEGGRNHWQLVKSLIGDDENED
jgi:serine phosphatase RsbU (regulator of sigma subunit)/anti-sigma regulatory factor (Ser/Thr protein kinase)